MPKLWTLDALRGIAAVAVAAFHFNLLSNQTSSAYLAVDFFFALSGFVIAYAYDARLSAGMGFREFAVRRLIRLYPLYVLGLTLGLVIALLQQFFGSEQGMTALPFLQFACALIFVPFPPLGTVDLVSPLNGPYWSLILEIHINIAFALAFRWLSVKVVVVLVGLFAVLLVGTSWVHGHLEVGFRASEFHLGVVRIGFSFFVGVLACRLSNRLHLPKLPWMFPLVAAVILLTIPSPLSLRWAYDVVCVAFLFPLLILLGSRSQAISPRLQSVFAIVGAASYALYAIHMPLQVLLMRVTERLPEALVPIWKVGFLAVVCSAAVGVVWAYDRPVRRWLAARLTDPPAPERTSSAVNG